MRDPAADYMRELFLGLKEGGIDFESLTDSEFAMLKVSINSDIRKSARGFAIALDVLRGLQVAAMREP